MKWLFLVHQVQTKNSRERVKIWRLTKKIGAVLYRNSVYVLPYSSERNEDFQWLSIQIRDFKGEASVFVTESNDSKENEELIMLFDSERQKDYEQILTKSKEAIKQIEHINPKKNIIDEIKNKTKSSLQIINEYEEINKIDYFNSSVGAEVKVVIDKLKQKLYSVIGETTPSKKTSNHSIQDFQNKTWATRAKIHIDRVASGWLIGKFIDKDARFIFCDENTFPVEAIPFDTFGTEFGHHGDNCTFETLLKEFKIKDKALFQIAEIVHDIDLKDNKYQRSEAAGIDTTIRSLSNHFNDDLKTLEFGSILFDSLYNNFRNNNRSNKK